MVPLQTGHTTRCSDNLAEDALESGRLVRHGQSPTAHTAARNAAPQTSIMSIVRKRRFVRKIGRDIKDECKQPAVWVCQQPAASKRMDVLASKCKQPTMKRCKQASASSRAYGHPTNQAQASGSVPVPKRKLWDSSQQFTSGSYAMDCGVTASRQTRRLHASVLTLAAWRARYSSHKIAPSLDSAPPNTRRCQGA